MVVATVKKLEYAWEEKRLRTSIRFIVPIMVLSDNILKGKRCKSFFLVHY